MSGRGEGGGGVKGQAEGKTMIYVSPLCAIFRVIHKMLLIPSDIRISFSGR